MQRLELSSEEPAEHFVVAGCSEKEHQNFPQCVVSMTIPVMSYVLQLHEEQAEFEHNRSICPDPKRSSGRKDKESAIHQLLRRRDSS